LGALVGCFVDIDESLLNPEAGADGTLDAPDTASDAGDAGNTGDAAGDGSADADVLDVYLGVPCGDGPCAPPVSVCCATSFGDPDYRRGECSTRNDCQTGDYFACTNGRDCAYTGSAGPRCCIVRLPGGAWTQTACMDACDAGALCGPSEPLACPAGQTCRASLDFPVLFECL
jgi:hypothetical protein